MAQTQHVKAAELHGAAAESRRKAAELHGKKDDTAGLEHVKKTAGLEHVKKADTQSAEAHKASVAAHSASVATPAKV
jgi:hypothetical protein